MNKKQTKTPEYTRRAVDAYASKHKRLTLCFTDAEIERIRAAGIDNATCKRLIFEELERRETENKQ